jgi:hypothetical protein
MTKTLKIKDEDAVAHVALCMNEPGVHLNDPLTLPCAQIVWAIHGERQHQCYWNDRFVTAVMCGMDEQSQRVAAWSAVSNGLIGYWEWRTHYGFDTAAALKHLDLVRKDFDPDDLRPPGRFPDYNYLAAGFPRALVEKFKLPTTVYGATLSAEQIKERNAFDLRYPELSPLYR